MKVRVLIGSEHCYSNIMFPDKWPMRGGKFPAQHPCHIDSKPMVMGKVTRHHKAGTKEDIAGEQPESTTNIGRFRERGYWASCFPEGDGITFEALNGQTVETINRDIADCFGFEIE